LEKIIVTAAITGSGTLPTQTPHLPITPDQIAEEAYRSWKAGAAITHIHARDPKTGQPTGDLKVFREILTKIKDKCDIIVCITTGGAVGMTREQRITVVSEFKPEMSSFNCGSMNFSIHKILDRFNQFTHPWEKEYAEYTKDGVFRNTFEDLEYFCKTMLEHETKPELEIYDVGMLFNARYLIREGILSPPVHMQFVQGILGGIGTSVYDMMNLKTTADRLFGDRKYTWSVIGVGYPAEFHLAAVSIILGGHGRVGMEDNIKLSRSEVVKSNAQLVEKAVRLARELDRDVATPDEARKILNLKGLDKVGF